MWEGHGEACAGRGNCGCKGSEAGNCLVLKEQEKVTGDRGQEEAESNRSQNNSGP